MEYLLIDKVGDYHYFNKIQDIATYLDLTKGVVTNICVQSLRKYNKYTNRGYYIQRLFNDPTRPLKLKFNQETYIYYVNDDGSLRYGQRFK